MREIKIIIRYYLYLHPHFLFQSEKRTIIFPVPDYLREETPRIIWFNSTTFYPPNFLYNLEKIFLYYYFYTLQEKKNLEKN